MKKNKLLVIGASGMLGNAIMRYFFQNSSLEVVGTVRSADSKKLFPLSIQSKLLEGINVENLSELIDLFSLIKPDIVINCVGLVKQHIYAEDPLLALPINSLLPHYLARLSKVSGARLIHISTDCVYSGSRGMYLETDQSDAHDLYGRSKFLGEVHCSNAITLRTSIIGHELNGSKSLVNWFLSQKNCIQGYTKAIFSGLPTVEIARVIHHYILPNSGLNGLYHLSAEPISKFELLSLIKDQYEKEIEIISNEAVVIDRSLDSTKFRVATGFKPKPWVNLIQEMHEFH